MSQMENDGEFVAAAMSQPRVIDSSEDSEGSCMPTPAKEQRTKNKRVDVSTSEDVAEEMDIGTNSNNSELLAAFNKMQNFVAAQLEQHKSDITEQFKTILKRETDCPKREMETQISILTDKVKTFEKSQLKENSKLARDIEAVGQKVNNMEQNYSDIVKRFGQYSELSRSVVIKNLPLDSREAKNAEVTGQVVNKLIRDGLKLGQDIRVARASRKQRSDEKPGIIPVLLDTVEQRRKLLENKRKLKDIPKYSKVFVDPAMSHGELVNRANMRAVIQEAGIKSLKFHGRRLSKNKN